MAQLEIATLAGGCFWCLEAVYQEMHGILSVQSGYMGGSVPNPTYQAVCTGATGHAEAVQIRFDPAAVSFRELLEVFFVIHDPTTLNRQGNDTGTQYRSAIFYHSDEQKRIAQEFLNQLTLEGAFPDPIVTEVTPATEFYAAEAYHQNYFRSHAEQPYCQYVVAPKLMKFRKSFAAKRRAAV
jgi:peptide-methionine (S)-S-oxide reductase